jgi:hypothetical protein
MTPFIAGLLTGLACGAVAVLVATARHVDKAVQRVASFTRRLPIVTPLPGAKP